MESTAPVQVVVAGGGIAALELVAALRAHAGDRVAVTLVAPGPDLVERPDAVLEPFVAGHARRYGLRRLADVLGFALVADGVRGVAHHDGRVALDSGASLPFDELVIATGATPVPALPHATTVLAADADALHWVVRELEDGSVDRVAVVVPEGGGWSLPAYELAFLLAARAGRAAGGPAVTLVTSEERPLQAFGGAVSNTVAARLGTAGVALRTNARDVERTADGVRIGTSGEVLPAGRVLALPVLRGPDVSGVPVDGAGFVRVGSGFAVPGHAGVHAIGDAAGHPVKQGGLAAQQADVVAAAIARRAGADVVVPAYEGVLRATLVTGERTGDRLYLTGRVSDPGAADATDARPSWAGRKVASEHLAPLLDALDREPAAG